VYVLCMLVRVYETDVLCLLDLADHEGLPQRDRLVLMRRQRAQTPFGERVLALAEERGLSLRELARRVPCDASHLSKVVHGRKRPSLRVAARLTMCWRRAGNWSRSRRRQGKHLTCLHRDKTPPGKLAQGEP
jgi:hypothetical protein